jgi:hypothetical protein
LVQSQRWESSFCWQSWESTFPTAKIASASFAFWLQIAFEFESGWQLQTRFASERQASPQPDASAKLSMQASSRKALAGDMGEAI